MTIEEIIKLVDAGYTKDEIASLEQPNAANLDTNGAAKENHDDSNNVPSGSLPNNPNPDDTRQPVPVPSPNPVPSTPDNNNPNPVTAPTPTPATPSSLEQKLDKMIALLQAGAIVNSNMPTIDPQTLDSIAAAIIAPTK